jgi:hypothetical protein
LKPRELSELEKARALTNYNKARTTGYAAYPMAACAENFRLTSLAGTRVLDFVIVWSTGRRVPKGDGFLEVTEEWDIAKVAEVTHLEIRTLEREIKDLKDRKVIKATRIRRGIYTFRPLFRTWASLPNYKPGPVLEPKPEPQDVPIDEEKEKKAKEVTYLIEKPIHVRAGKKTKRLPVPCGVAFFECKVTGQIDAGVSAVIKDGVFQVTVEGKWDGRSTKGDLLHRKELQETQRHHSREKANTAPRNSKRSKSEETHPRAAELSALFDPLLLKSCGKSLSGDPPMLQAACEAIAGADQDYVARCAVDRAFRPISGPKVVVSICKEIAANWEKVKGLPANQRIPEPKKRDSFTERVMAKARENFKKYGSIS